MPSYCLQCKAKLPVGSLVCMQCGFVNQQSKSPPKLTLKIVWYVFLGLLLLGAFAEASHGEISGFGLVALFGLPTFWLFKGLQTRVKAIATGAFAFIFICFAIFSITPQGKVANASYQKQEAHDAQIAEQKQKKEEAKQAKEQAKQDAEQAKQKAEQAKQDAANQAQQAKNEQNSTSTKMDAYEMAQQFVTDSLKSPGSAKYPDYDDGYVQLISDNTYNVTAYVDSQNSFGASIRGY